MPRRSKATVPAERPLRLVSAATRSLKLGNTTSSPPDAKWQDEAWDYFDTVPEVKFTVIYLGDAMAKLRLFVGTRPAPGDEPVPVGATDSGVDGQLAADAEAELGRLRDATGGQGDTLRAVNQNLEVAGECYLIGYGARLVEAEGIPAVTVPERWEVRSRSEVRFAKAGRAGLPPTVTIHDDPGSRGVALDPELDTVIRLWHPHPRYKAWADCALKGVLNDCAALKILAQQSIAEGNSRLHANLLMAPNDLSFGAAEQANGAASPDDEDGDPFAEALMSYITAPISNPSSAASVMPGVLRGSIEALAAVRVVELGRGRTEEINAAIEAKAGRLARGMNVPPEVMMGHMQTTFANAEAVDQDTFDDHLRPRAELICEALTAQFLRPALLSSDGRPAHSPDAVARVFVWYDASALVSQPDPGESVVGAWEDGLVSNEARRRVQGFDEGDKPEMAEVLLNTALRRGIFTADLTTAMLAEGGVDLDVASEVAAVVEAEQGALPPEDDALAAAMLVLAQSPELVATLAAAAGRGRRPFVLAAAQQVRRDPPGRRLLTIDQALRDRLTGAADSSMGRALERAGNRVKGQARNQATLARVPAVRAAATLGRSLVAQTLSTEQLLAGGWDDLERQFRAWAAQAQDEALDVVADVVGGFSLGERDRLGLRQAGDVDEAWAWFRGALDAVAGDRMFDPDPAAPEFGEFDATLRVPTGLVRQAIARAGGAAGLETNGAGSAWVALTDGGTRPAGGVGTGQLVRDALRDHGAGIEGYRWVYGSAQRGRPFPPHARLDGTTFEEFTADVLRNPGTFPPFSYLLPGDHSGCRCDVEPIVLPPPGRS